MKKNKNELKKVKLITNHVFFVSTDKYLSHT